MSRIYEALKKAERERRKKTGRLSTSAAKPLTEEAIEKKEVKQQKPLDIILKVQEKFPEDQTDNLLVTLNDSCCPSSDQFMKVCVRMTKNGHSDKRVVLVTSAFPQEGKTVATANLAIGLARLPDTHVTLIDGDLRKPDLHKLLSINVDKGLGEYLQEKADISEIYYSTPVSRLFVVPGGEPILHPERVLSSDKVKKLFNKLRSKHPTGYIIIDAPPILLSTEPEIILNNVDSLIMIVRYGKTRRGNLRKALDLVDKNKILGLIFNRVDQSYFPRNHCYPRKENIYS
jgi:capsular exopolysaccharide synthesis family protein